MKPAETWLYGLLLIVTLGFAYSAWQEEGDEGKAGSNTEIVVFDPGKSGVSRIHWDSKKAVTTLQVEGRGEALKAWVTSGKRKKIAPEPATEEATVTNQDLSPGAEAKDKVAATTGSTTGAEAATPEATTTPAPQDPEYGPPELRSFPGGKQARELADRFAPLMALRSFDDLSQESLADMGLTEPEGSLEVEGAGRTLRLEVGSKAYGSSDTYVRNPSTNTVYLLSSKALGALRTGSTRLMERNLFDFEAIDVAQATVQPAKGGSSREFSHQGRHDEANSYWADPQKLEDVDTAADGFFKKVFQLRATTYATEAEQPDTAAMEPLFVVSFDESTVPAITLSRLVNQERSKDDESVYDYYAQSPITRDQWVKVSRTTGSDLADALDGLLGS
ncbi:MAG: hypothetical protein CL928_06605 [Deltaproteobacteria bacterium]|nr:hypothetical protein [Deltaproteobacteria bacterium]